MFLETWGMLCNHQGHVGFLKHSIPNKNQYRLWLANMD